MTEQYSNEDLSIAERISRDLKRYAESRQHQQGEEVFKERLFRLQQWQVERLKYTHRDLLASRHYHAPTEFVLTEIYGGKDLTALANEIERATQKALKIFPEKVMTTAALALEMNAITVEMDERMTEVLFEDFNVQQIDGESYLSAYKSLDNFAERHRQIELGETLAKNIDKYVKSKMLYGAFKLVKKPALKKGFVNLYGFMDEGFRVLRPIDSTYKLLKQIADKEIEHIHRITEGDNNPYDMNHHQDIAV